MKLSININVSHSVVRVRVFNSGTECGDSGRYHRFIYIYNERHMLRPCMPQIIYCLGARQDEKPGNRLHAESGSFHSGRNA